MEATNLNQYHTTKRDERRNKALVRMEVCNRNTLTLQVLQNTIGIGKHTITVYEDEVPKVEAMVEREPRLLEEALAAYELEMSEQVARDIGYPGQAADLLLEIKAGTNEDAVRNYKRIERTGSLSPQGMFRRRNKRDMKPLEYARKLEGSEHAEPQKEELENDAKRTAAAFSAAIKDAVQEVIAAIKPAGGVDVAAMVKAQVAEELARQLGDKPKAK